MAITPSTSCVQRAAFMFMRRCPCLVSTDRQAKRMPSGATSVFDVRRPSPGPRGAAAGLEDTQRRRRRAGQEVARPARPRPQFTVAVGAAPVQTISRTIGAECALEAADEGGVAGGGKIHVTAFAVWAEFEHVSLIACRCLCPLWVRISIAPRPAHRPRAGSSVHAGRPFSRSTTLPATFCASETPSQALMLYVASGGRRKR